MGNLKQRPRPAVKGDCTSPRGYGAEGRVWYPRPVGERVHPPEDTGDTGAKPCPLCGGHHPGKPCASRPTPGSTLALGGPSVTPLPEQAFPPMDPLVGAMVGSFKVVRQIGRGGMGTVYLAEHPVIGSKVAIKFLHESMSSDADLVGRFYDEARIVNLIGHENIVGIFDLAILPPSRYYIVMEYLEGETLTSLLRNGAVEPRAALAILLQLCDALHCAHARGVVHRDLKPDNVFLLKRRGSSHFAKLVDFGIAKLRDRAGRGHTAAGMIVGTPEYMAPEQCDNRPVDARADVYALGVMAYELATGRLPFSGMSIAQLLLAHLNERPVPPRQVNPGTHPLLEAAILRALEKRPQDRFGDMGAFGDALTAALDALAGGPASASAAAAAPGRAPASPSATVATAGAAPAAPPVEVEVQLPGDPTPRRLRAGELTRAGVYIHAAGNAPPVFSRLRVRLARPAPAPPLELQAEVVRQVSPADAAAWNMPPGFAVQFVDLAPGERSALAQLAAEPARSAPAAPAPAADAESFLAALEKRARGNHYELLGVTPDADFVEIRASAARLARDVGALRERPLPADKASLAASLLERLSQAAAVLGTPSERLLFDARRGNHLGVARCVAAGIPAQVLESRRRDLIAESPGAEERAQKHLVKAKVARAMRNMPVALAEYEAALEADPLNLSIHEAYWAVRRELG